MSSNNDGSDDISALLPLEKKALVEARRFTKTCGNKIAEDQKKFADKGFWGLWWDAKGFFNCSDVEDVTDHMEKYKKIFERIDNLFAQVEKGDPESCQNLKDIYKDLTKIETDTEIDIKNSRSSAICRMLREFLDEKFHLHHNLQKVECIVRRQKESAAEKARERSEIKNSQMHKKIDDLREKNCATLRKYNELEEKSESCIREMEKQNAELILEADKRSEAIRLESEERLKQVLKEVEGRAEARFQKMKDECDKLRLEAQVIRQESEEKLKQAVEEANRRSEVRMQEMAEQNRANLQNITKMLEAMNVP